MLTPTIPSGMTLHTELHTIAGTPIIHLVYLNGLDCYGFATYLLGHGEREVSYVDQDLMSLRYAVYKMASAVGTSDLMHFEREVNRWSPND